MEAASSQLPISLRIWETGIKPSPSLPSSQLPARPSPLAPPSRPLLTFMQPPVVLPEWYEVEEPEIRRGSNYVIFKASDLRLIDTLPDEATVAIKCIPRGPAVSRTVQEDLMVHRFVWHLQIAAMREVFLTNTHLCVAFDFSHSRTIADLVQEKGRLSEEVARWIFQQLLMVVDYYHRLEIVNLDIELKNMLIDEHLSVGGATDKPLIKFCDFGARREGNGQSQLPCGEQLYNAPEVYVDDHSLADYNRQSADVWSCGVCLFYMLYGAFFVMQNRDVWWETGLLQNFDMEVIIPDHIGEAVELSEQCKDFLEHLLQVNPADRISMNAIWSHEWFKTDLPDGCQEYNTTVTTDRTLLQESIKNMQRTDELLAIFQLARRLDA